MTAPPVGARILLATKPVDFRKGAHSLAALAAEVLAADPFSGAVLVFRSRRADRIKILLWDGRGLVLVWKQLDISINPGSRRMAPYRRDLGLDQHDPHRRPGTARRALARRRLTRASEDDRLRRWSVQHGQPIMMI